MTYIIVEARRVKEWCEYTIKTIEDWRIEEAEERIKHYMQSKKGFFTTTPGLSREDAVKMFYHGRAGEKTKMDLMTDYFTRNAYDRRYGAVKSLLKLVNTAIEENGSYSSIHLSLEDHRHLMVEEENDA